MTTLVLPRNPFSSMSTYCKMYYFGLKQGYWACEDISCVLRIFTKSGLPKAPSRVNKLHLNWATKGAQYVNRIFSSGKDINTFKALILASFREILGNMPGNKERRNKHGFQKNDCKRAH